MYPAIAMQDTVDQDPNKHLSVLFVDADNFNNLQSQHFNISQFRNLIHTGENKKALSVMSLAYLSLLNNYLSDLVLGTYQPTLYVPLTEREQSYTTYAVQTDMKECPANLHCDTGTKLSYDTLPVDGQTLIVVVQKGFLNQLASSKDKYRDFVLACIRCMDRFNCDLSQLNQLYLRLQLTSAPYELMRCRIQ